MLLCDRWFIDFSGALLISNAPVAIKMKSNGPSTDVKAAWKAKLIADKPSE